MLNQYKLLDIGMISMLFDEFVPVDCKRDII